MLPPPFFSVGTFRNSSGHRLLTKGDNIVLSFKTYIRSKLVAKVLSLFYIPQKWVRATNCMIHSCLFTILRLQTGLHDNSCWAVQKLLENLVKFTMKSHFNYLASCCLNCK